MIRMFYCEHCKSVERLFLEYSVPTCETCKQMEGEVVFWVSPSEYITESALTKSAQEFKDAHLP